MQPEPILGDGNLEQPVLPRAALYVPGNPSLLAASHQHQPEGSPWGTRTATVASAASVVAAEDPGMYYSTSSGELPAPQGREATPAPASPGRQLSIKDRIAALESQGSESQELQPATPAAKSRGSELRQGRRSTLMLNGAGGEALSHSGRIESLCSYRGKLSASLLPNIDRAKLQQDAMQGELHGPSPQLSCGEPLEPAGLPGRPAQPSASLPVGTSREILHHRMPATSLPPTDREALPTDAKCAIDLWADKSPPAGTPAPAASKFKDGEIGTETFPDCMYVGTFRNGMRNGLGALLCPLISISLGRVLQVVTLCQ